MSYKAQKRKYKHFNPRDNDNHDHDEGAAAESSHASLYIQAHEADIVRGAQALAAAHSLEIERDTNGKEVRIGSALIQWGYHSDQGSENATGTWIDRYAIPSKRSGFDPLHLVYSQSSGIFVSVSCSSDHSNV